MDKTNPLYYFLEEKNSFMFPEIEIPVSSLVIKFLNGVKVTPVRLTHN